MQMIRDSLSDGYCDKLDLMRLGELSTTSVTSSANDCVQGEMRGVRLFCPKGEAVENISKDTHPNKIYRRYPQIFRAPGGEEGFD